MTMKRHQSTRASNNTNGFRGVEWDSERGMFRARIEPSTGRRGRWLGRFGTAREAAIAYDIAAREEYGDDAYLNFPQKGEKGVVQNSREESGRCANGHLLSKHGYDRPDGRGQNCRECNRAASARAYQKRKSS